MLSSKSLNNSILLATGLIQSGDGTNLLLNAMGNACLTFFPVILGYTSAVAFGMDPFIGMALGATLMFPGLAESINSGDPIGSIFSGGMAQRVRAIVTLAAPLNGTTAYDMALDRSFDMSSVKIPVKHKLLDRVMKSQTKIKTDGRDSRDWANYDMLLDNAQALNAKMPTMPHVYYLSVACDATVPGARGTRLPNKSLLDPLFEKSATLMGCYCGTTKAGFVIDDEWHANDGLVNTISARAPFGEPQKPLDRSNIEKGIWNVMPDLRADHAFFTGGHLKKQNPHQFFRDLVELLESLD